MFLVDQVDYCVIFYLYCGVWMCILVWIVLVKMC